MRRRSLAVIGANFGDEGKGLITDFLVSEASPSDTIVVRFNGGAQAGHTVVSPTGVRHIFRHFGSGSLLGAPTYLSRFFIVNPMAWKDERNELRLAGGVSRLYVHPLALLTTPYDMLVNQEIERIRGNARHGSCGLGIHETVVRCETEYRTTVSSVSAELCKRIRDEWVPRRMARLAPGIKPSDRFVIRVHSDTLLSQYLYDLQDFYRSSTWSSSIPYRETTIFEGAQGLLLDQDHEFFPHVTCSRTGIRNVLSLCSENGITDVESIYVSRAYLTRHGPGPFPGEDLTLSYPDTTNAPNEFQGSLRFGRLDPQTLWNRIYSDGATRLTAPLKPSTCRLALTCLDQVEDPEKLVQTLDPDFVSFGPTRKDVTRV